MAFVNASGWEMEKEGVSRMEFSSVGRSHPGNRSEKIGIWGSCGQFRRREDFFLYFIGRFAKVFLGLGTHAEGILRGWCGGKSDRARGECANYQDSCK